ncbi:hypothetical protein CC80DRAFT_156284 [Byssothecium circinans]|uniref:Uncharacterized protein n=1 Tax=Byssothecium circinans TaxID=147558 RepID=A0A6A5UAH3_9PLEO|nr:hypothetical protein CC80DRAFT_156284 [Byssothecium circinans]
MLTQDDFLAPNMSGEGRPLHRSSWKAEAIRRGDIKISRPIPIPEDMPINKEEERDFGEGQMVEVPPSSIPPLPASVDALKEPPSLDHAQHDLALSNVPPNIVKDDSTSPPNQNIETTEDRPQTGEANRPPQQNHLTAGARDMDSTHRRSATEPVSYSTPSPYPSVIESSTKTTPKKRKSGLRNAFRKMFGRRSRGESIEEERERETQSRGHSHHVSDPGMLRTSSERKPARRGPRISDLPVQEPTPINPLAQHLPFPMNVNAPQEASPPHEYLTFEAPPPDLGRRRATLPGIFAEAETQSLDGRVKRLETWEERHEDGSIPSPQIGIALSSPPTQSINSIQSKRRSRSAGALRELAKARPSAERRRSAEIRFWRSSYASASMYSNTSPRPRTAQTVDTVTSIKDDTEPQPSESITKYATTAPALDQTVPQHDQDLSQIQLPVEAFNFGNLKSGFSEDEDSEHPTVSPSPVQSPPLQRVEEGSRRLSIEDRVKNLEEEMRTLGSSVHRLSGRNNRQTIILENVPKGRRSSRNRSSSGASERQESHHSSSRSRPSSRNLSLRPNSEMEVLQAPASPTLAPLSAVNEDASKPKSRGSSNERTPPTAAQYTTLLAHLTTLQAHLSHERHSRKALESQVLSLQCEIANLHTLVQRILQHTSTMSSRAENYPTPSPDAFTTGSQGTIGNEEKMPTPRASKGEAVGKGHGEDSGIAGMSGYGSDASSREDFGSPEAWATPKEEASFLFQGRGEAGLF